MSRKSTSTRTTAPTAPAPAQSSTSAAPVHVPAPSHPRQLTLSLNGPRRRKLHALLEDLKAQKAVVPGRRGSVTTDLLVATYQDAILWLLDQTEEATSE